MRKEPESAHKWNIPVVICDICNL